VISKPFSSDELRAKVRKVVASSLSDVPPPSKLPESAHVDARDGAAHQ
jgi:DNA-binding response OmpR family regulator